MGLGTYYVVKDQKSHLKGIYLAFGTIDTNWSFIAESRGDVRGKDFGLCYNYIMKEFTDI